MIEDDDLDAAVEVLDPETHVRLDGFAKEGGRLRAASARRESRGERLE